MATSGLRVTILATMDPELLVRTLAESRRRGMSFADAWPDAVFSVMAGLSPRERAEWLTALEGTRGSWRRV